MTALIGRLSVTLLVVGSNKVTSCDAVLKTIPRVPCAPGPAVAPVAPPVELTAVSSRTELPVPQPASKIPTRAPPVMCNILRRVIVRSSNGAATLRSLARSDEPPDVALGPHVGSSAHLDGFFGVAFPPRNNSALILPPIRAPCTA